MILVSTTETFIQLMIHKIFSVIKKKHRKVHSERLERRLSR